jgi:hypothetical protein
MQRALAGLGSVLFRVWQHNALACAAMVGPLLPLSLPLSLPQCHPLAAGIRLQLALAGLGSVLFRVWQHNALACVDSAAPQPLLPVPRGQGKGATADSAWGTR